MLYLPLPLEPFIDVKDFNAGIFYQYSVIRRARQTKRTRPEYLDCTCAFDIESTNIQDIQQAVMYVWQFQISTDLTVFGRTWDEFIWMLQQILPVLKTNVWLVVYVHNLSYEFSFLKGIYDFREDEVFCLSRRKVLKCTMYDKIEFRCSYKLSNSSLKDFTRKYKVKHLKLLDFDYDVQRYPWTLLTVEELRYCQNDVLGLVEAVNALMLSEKDNLMTIPMTSTGYVRRECKKVMAEGVGYRYAEPFYPDPLQYKLLRKAFRGGDTHCNRWYVDQTLEGEQAVHSWDRSSSYPDVLCNEIFPMTPFVQVLEKLTVERLETLVYKRHRALLMQVKLTNVKLKNRYWCDPYLTEDKSDFIVNAQIFNGRILSADSLITVITEIDYDILKQVYDFEIDVQIWFKANKKPLPDCFKNFIIGYYKKKTELKGLKGSTPEETEYNERSYLRSKNFLNSIYGMTVQVVIREEVVYDKNDRDFHYKEVDESELFETSKSRYWLPYQWGVWCTAYSRQMLFRGLQLVSKNQDEEDDEKFSDAVYWDTDSVKYIGNGADWTPFNQERIRKSIESGAYAADKYGTVHYMGVFEEETPAEGYAKFRSCGAKKYAYELNGKLSVTIAGVNKKKGGKELAEKGGIDALADGFEFVAAGGTAAVYNDKPAVTDYYIDKHWIKITSNVFLYQSTYTVGDMEIYKRILHISKIDLDRIERILYNEGVLLDDAEPN